METSTANYISEIMSIFVTGAIIMIVSGIIGIVLYLVPLIVNDYILFKKANQNKWAALIPFYSVYVFGVISKRSKFWIWATIISPVLYHLLPVVSLVFMYPLFEGSFYVTLFLFLVSGLFIFIIPALFIYLINGFVRQFKVDNIPPIIYWSLYLFVPIAALFWTNKLEYIGDAKQDTTLSPLNTSGAPTQKNDPNMPINVQNVNSTYASQSPVITPLFVPPEPNVVEQTVVPPQPIVQEQPFQQQQSLSYNENPNGSNDSQNK